MGSIGALKELAEFFISNPNKRVARKLRRIIVLHIALVIFNFHIPKIQKVIICMIFGTSGQVHDPQSQLFLTLKTPNSFTKYKKIQNHFRTNNTLGNIIFLRKTRAGKSLMSVL